MIIWYPADFFVHNWQCRADQKSYYSLAQMISHSFVKIQNAFNRNVSITRYIEMLQILQP